MLRPLLWMLLFLVSDGIGTRLMGEEDGSFTWFLFRGLTVATTAGAVVCFCWFAITFCAWAWSQM